MKTLAYLNATFMTGFKTAESNIEDLVLPVHDRYFSVLESSEEQTKYNELQKIKM